MFHIALSSHNTHSHDTYHLSDRSNGAWQNKTFGEFSPRYNPPQPQLRHVVPPVPENMQGWKHRNTFIIIWSIHTQLKVEVVCLIVIPPCFAWLSRTDESDPIYTYLWSCETFPFGILYLSLKATVLWSAVCFKVRMVFTGWGLLFKTWFIVFCYVLFHWWKQCIELGGLLSIWAVVLWLFVFA